MKGDKKKIFCHECGASYSIDISKIPETTRYFKCLKCGHRVPLLSRLVKPKKRRCPDAAPCKDGKGQKGESTDDCATSWSCLEADGWSGAATDHAMDDGEGDSWLAVYGDIMSLLLIFFILMFAISTINRKKFETVMEAVSKALGGHVSYATVRPPVAAPLPRKQPPVPQNEIILDKIKRQIAEDNAGLSAVLAKLSRLINENSLQDKFMLLQETKGIVIVTRDMSMFDRGSADIKDNIKPFLQQIGTILKQIDNDILVEGHTDDIPIHSARFSSNWELSVMRATNVVHFLAQNCAIKPDRLGAAGYAYFRPRYPMNSPDKVKNRRIEIIVKRKYADQAAAQLMRLQEGS